MDGPRDYHTKSSQKEKDKYHMISLICGISNMTQMNLFTKQKQTHRHRKETYGYQRGNKVEGLIRSLGLTYTHYYI